MAQTLTLKATRRFLGNSRKATYTYDYHEIDRFIQFLTEIGYDCVQTSEGVLGSGNWICVRWEAPYGEDTRDFVIREIPLNSQSSTHIIRQYKELPQKYQNELGRRLDEIETELEEKGE